MDKFIKPKSKEAHAPANCENCLHTIQVILFTKFVSNSVAEPREQENHYYINITSTLHQVTSITGKRRTKIMSLKAAFPYEQR